MSAGRRIKWSGTRTRLTWAGWVYSVMTTLLAVGALKVQVPLLYLLVGGMMGALLISALLARRMVRYLRLERDAPSRVWQNQIVHVGYYLRNTQWGTCLSLTLRERGDGALHAARAYLACLGSRGTARAGGRFVARRRGPMTLGAVDVSSDFPFSLVRASRRLDCPVELLVWPGRGRLKRPLLHRGAVEVSTAAPSPVSGGADDFFGLRDYRGGDNPRWIHWRRSAGRTVPVLREMSRPVPDLLYVLLDTQADPADTRQLQQLERMIRFCATLVHYAIWRDYQVGLGLAYPEEPRVVPAAPGRGQLHKLLDCLALVGVNPQRGLEEVAERLTRAQLRYAQVVLLAGRRDHLGPGVWRPLRQGCRHLTVLTPAQLDAFYEDEPLSAAPVAAGGQ